MVIKSPFKDYYDCMQSTDQDRLTKFIRQPVGEKAGWEWPFPEASHSSFNTVKATTHVVGFCGKIYGIVELSYVDDSGARDAAFCHDAQEVDGWFASHLDEAQMATYEDEAHTGH